MLKTVFKKYCWIFDAAESDISDTFISRIKIEIAATIISWKISLFVFDNFNDAEICDEKHDECKLRLFSVDSLIRIEYELVRSKNINDESFVWESWYSINFSYHLSYWFYNNARAIFAVSL